MQVDFKILSDFLDGSHKDMVDLEKLLTCHKALAPENGGDGELEKCQALEEFLKANGIADLKRYDAPDSRVSAGFRPNLVATIPGKDDHVKIWCCAHMDVVPTGDLASWNTDPWTAVEKDGKIYGRGVEDNQQGLVSGVFAALAFVKNGIVPEHTVKLLFMADEEVGSKYGMDYLLENHLEIFSKDDLILIPDGGDPKGETIEVAEKNILWLKFHTVGKQCHGSRPDLGHNACLAGCDLALRIHGLKDIFNSTNPLFDPPYSTFEPTQKFRNVDGINIIPGDDIFCADCRINPEYSLDQVRSEIRKIVSEIEKKYSVTVEVSEPQAGESKATPVDAPVVKLLSKAMKDVHGIESKVIGIGGGTVGAGLRNLGYNCVVWSTMDETMHQPNEYCVIKNIVADAKTIAYMAACE